MKRILDLGHSLESILEAKLKEELKTLVELESFLELTESRLEQLYQDIFPKKCNSCSMVYKTREDYLNDTLIVKGSQEGHQSFETFGKIAEFRNCRCGSTLMVLTTNRRDESKLGKIRRQLFNECREKLNHEFGLEDSLSCYILRLFFSKIRLETQESEDTQVY